MIILGQISIILGVKQWNEIYSTDGKDSPLGIIHIVLYFTILLCIEVGFRVFKSRRPKPYTVPNDKTMTIDDFNSKLIEGKVSLMILDDLVLDVTRYLDDHPGGRFLIEYCIGRDISKFYYGGYALDNNDIKGKSKRHAHSNISHLQVQSLIIARLIPNPNDLSKSAQATKFEAVIKERQEVTKGTNTLVFSISSSSKESNYLPSNYYEDIQMIGRHYLISEVGRHKVKRHFTIANCMEKSVY